MRERLADGAEVIVIIMGIAGSGKTTVGRELAKVTGGTFFDADDFHPARNIEKMRRGEPLTRADRQPWLDTLRRLVEEWAARDGLAILACSALTRRSRRCLHVGHDGVELVFLRGSTELIETRMRARRHFMPPELLASQLTTLELPCDALELDIRQPVHELVGRIRETWGL